MGRGLVGAVFSVALFFGGLGSSAVGVARDYEKVTYAGMALTAAGLCLLGRGITRDIDEMIAGETNEETARIENENRARRAVTYTEIEAELDSRPKSGPNSYS